MRARASLRRGSRITSRREYVRDEHGRFARSGSSRYSTAKAVGATTALVIAATAAGTAIAVTSYHRDTAALATAYKSALAAENMDHRVHQLVQKHRAIQRNSAEQMDHRVNQLLTKHRANQRNSTSRRGK